jgi:predicted site-specific integrase-resolvase
VQIQANVTGRKIGHGPPKARRVLDACQALGISRASLYRLHAAGKVKFVHIAGRTVIPETEIDRLASEGT